MVEYLYQTTFAYWNKTDCCVEKGDKSSMSMFGYTLIYWNEWKHDLTYEQAVFYKYINT